MMAWSRGDALQKEHDEKVARVGRELTLAVTAALPNDPGSQVAALLGAACELMVTWFKPQGSRITLTPEQCRQVLAKRFFDPLREKVITLIY